MSPPLSSTSDGGATLRELFFPVSTQREVNAWQTRRTPRRKGAAEEKTERRDEFCLQPERRARGGGHEVWQE